MINIGYKERGTLTFSLSSEAGLVDKDILIDITGFNVSFFLHLKRFSPKQVHELAYGKIIAELVDTNNISIEFEFTNPLTEGAHIVEFKANNKTITKLNVNVRYYRGDVRFTVKDNLINFVINEASSSVYLNGEKVNHRIINQMTFFNAPFVPGDFEIVYKADGRTKYRVLKIEEKKEESIYPTMLINDSYVTKNVFTNLYRNLPYKFLNDGNFHLLNSPFRNVRQLSHSNMIVGNGKVIELFFDKPVNYCAYVNNGRVTPLIITTK